jgi:F-type H+-transporting ATPase subunit gamma
VSQERSLRRHLRTLHTLDEAVAALRALSAQHFRSARALLAAARAYRSEIATLLGVLDPMSDAGEGEAERPTGLVLVAADLGLVGDYTARLVHEALAFRAELGPGPLFCLGSRGIGPLQRAGVDAIHAHPAPASVASLTRLLLPLVDQILTLRNAGELGALWLVAARFEGAGHFEPVRARLLPVAAPGDGARVAASPYVDRRHLLGVVVREHVYATLTESLLEALASEHGKRLVVAESARAWLGERIDSTRRRVAMLRREASTQEVLEVASSARAAQRIQQPGGDAWLRPS